MISLFVINKIQQLEILFFLIFLLIFIYIYRIISFKQILCIEYTIRSI